MDPAGYVFISYSHGDGEYVDRLKKHLEDADLTVWTDSGIDYGDQWAGVIAKQIDGCAAFVPVMSSRSRESVWVRREILYAQQRKKPILPLLLEGDRFIELIDVHDEAVTDSRLPSSRWTERLRALAGDDRPNRPRAALDEVHAREEQGESLLGSEHRSPALEYVAPPSGPPAAFVEASAAAREAAVWLKQVNQRSGVVDASGAAREAAAWPKLFNHWSDAVGAELGKWSRPVRLEAGNLTVAVQSVFWANELQRRGRELLDSIARHVGSGVVARVIVFNQSLPAPPRV